MCEARRPGSAAGPEIGWIGRALVEVGAAGSLAQSWFRKDGWLQPGGGAAPWYEIGAVLVWGRSLVTAPQCGCTCGGTVPRLQPRTTLGWSLIHIPVGMGIALPRVVGRYPREHSRLQGGACEAPSITMCTMIGSGTAVWLRVACAGPGTPAWSILVGWGQGPLPKMVMMV